MKQTRLKVVKGEYDVELHAEIDGKKVLISIDPEHIDVLCMLLKHTRDQLVPSWEPNLTTFEKRYE